MPAFYKEKQRFNQWWLWLPILGTAIPCIGIFIYGMYVQLIQKIPWGDSPMSDTGLILFSILMFAIFGGIILLLYSAELTVEIHNRTVYHQFLPLSGRKRIGLEELSSWEVRRYNPLTEYGGYGLRGVGKKRALNVRGRVGLELKLKSGKILMLGTQKPDEIRAAMQGEWDKADELDD